MKTEIKHHLDEALKFFGSIPVTHNNVDLMAMGRQELRAIYACLDKAEKEKEKEAVEA